MNANQGQRWGIILVFLGFAIGIPGFWLLIAHDHFEATARIQMMRAATEVAPSGNGDSSNNADIIQTEFDVIQSETILSNVVNALHLDAEWGNSFAEGRKLEMNETLPLLKQSLYLRRVPSTYLTDINVTSENGDEAAKIANEIAKAYSDLCWEKSVHLLNATARGVIADRLVQIVDPARPPIAPIRSNRQLGKVLLGVGVLLLICGFVTFVRNWRRPDEAAV